MAKGNRGNSTSEQVIRIQKNGPYKVSGNVPLAKQLIVSDEEGTSTGMEAGKKYPEQKEYALCRCGQSGHKPFCDETHRMVDFDGTETASRKKYEDSAEALDGPKLRLTDREDLCVVARFCHAKGGAWDMAQTAETDQEAQEAAEIACNCPSGRLVAWDQGTGQAIEPQYEKSIGLIEYPMERSSGPLWVKGGIPVESSDGQRYEARNRQTLCRCGESSNKPFCDGSHLSAGFSDGDPSLEKKRPPALVRTVKWD